MSSSNRGTCLSKHSWKAEDLRGKERRVSVRASLSLSHSLTLKRSSGQILLLLLLLSPVDTAGNTRIAYRMDCWNSLCEITHLFPFISLPSHYLVSIHPSMSPDGFWFGQNADPGADSAAVGTQWRGFSQQCPNRWVTLLTWWLDRHFIYPTRNIAVQQIRCA